MFWKFWKFLNVWKFWKYWEPDLDVLQVFAFLYLCKLERLRTRFGFVLEMLDVFEMFGNIRNSSKTIMISKKSKIYKSGSQDFQNIHKRPKHANRTTFPNISNYENLQNLQTNKKWNKCPNVISFQSFQHFHHFDNFQKKTKQSKSSSQDFQIQDLWNTGFVATRSN